RGDSTTCSATRASGAPRPTGRAPSAAVPTATRPTRSGRTRASPRTRPGIGAIRRSRSRSGGSPAGPSSGSRSLWRTDRVDPLDRRSFLALAGAGAAALSLPSRPQAKKRRLRKSLMFGMVEGPAPLVEKFAKLKEVGFEGVELDSPSDRRPDE